MEAVLTFVENIVMPVFLPLHTVRETRAVVWSGCIMAADSVQEAVVGGHTHPSSPLRHWCAHTPFVRVGIETFHGAQTRASVTSTHREQPKTMENRSDLKLLQWLNFYKKLKGISIILMNILFHIRFTAHISSYDIIARLASFKLWLPQMTTQPKEVKRIYIIDILICFLWVMVYEKTIWLPTESGASGI